MLKFIVFSFCFIFVHSLFLNSISISYISFYIQRYISSSAWIEESNIKPYQQYKDTLVKSSKSIAFKDAVEAIEEFIAKGEVNLLFKIS